MIDEHQGQCIYENGRFRLREETDYAIIDELEDFPPIMVQMEEIDDGSESQYADRRGVLHLMNQLADTNPNEQRHFYLKYRLDKVHNDNDLLRKENEQLKSIVKEVIELLSEEVDVFSEKATEHDINAYIELKKLDNKDAYYMAISTKKAIKLLKELFK